MSVDHHEIDQLKNDFNEITNKKAEERPADFTAYLHLIQVKKIEQVFTWLKAKHITHQPSWSEVKNHYDNQEEIGK